MGLKLPPNKPRRIVHRGDFKFNKEGSPLLDQSEEDQVVSMNDFLVFLWPDPLLNVLRLQPFHAGQEVGGKIDEAFSEFLPIAVQTTHSVACFKLSGDVNDP